MKRFVACVLWSVLSLPCCAEVLKDDFYQHHAHNYVPRDFIIDEGDPTSANIALINPICTGKLQSSALIIDLQTEPSDPRMVGRDHNQYLLTHTSQLSAKNNVRTTLAMIYAEPDFNSVPKAILAVGPYPLCSLTLP